MRIFHVIVIETIERRIRVLANSKEEARRNWESGEIYAQKRTDVFIPLVDEAQDNGSR